MPRKIGKADKTKDIHKVQEKTCKQALHNTLLLAPWGNKPFENSMDALRASAKFDASLRDLIFGFLKILNTTFKFFGNMATHTSHKIG